MTLKQYPTAGLWKAKHVAARLGRNETWFRRNRKKLERHGFPKKDPILNLWIPEAVEEWLSQRSNIDSKKPKNNSETLTARARIIAHEKK